MGGGAGMILLLPERRRLAGAPDAGFARRLSRGITSVGEAGHEAQLKRHFRIEPDGWPIAALLRGAGAGDAGSATWLCADPVHVRAEMNGARLLAWGNLALEPVEADAFIEALAPGFAEFGVDIGRTQAAQWFLRLPAGLSPPPATAPADALGEDLFDHLPAGEHGRAWRRMHSDAQVVLHHHPANAARTAQGKPTVNAVWFWGGGATPARVQASVDALSTRDPELLALARAAGISTDARAGEGVLLDLRDVRAWDDPRVLQATAAAAGGTPTRLDFGDGTQVTLRRRQAWRFWERA